ncbi:MAG TPA: hypothetical protein VET85_13165 [Stellaceae bacterium]|nr:hypothetical protein [Stellaceae bacterium]
MARKRPRSTGEFVMFDVVYADGARSSNRKVPSAELEGIDGDAAARGIIEAQDKKVADLSGRPPRDIKSVTRSAG